MLGCFVIHYARTRPREARIVLYALAGWDPMIQLFLWLGTTGAFGVLCLLATNHPVRVMRLPPGW